MSEPRTHHLVPPVLAIFAVFCVPAVVGLVRSSPTVGEVAFAAVAVVAMGALLVWAHRRRWSGNRELRS